jgi:hypothetical protein
MIDPRHLARLETELNTFDLQARWKAFQQLLELARRGEIAVEPPGRVCNMHCHTFYSFNAYGHSPTSLAWLGKRQGFPLMGIVDFDVLDGVDEFLNATALAEVKGTAGIETRVFLPEFASREINSPGEPGVAYHMGIGFPSGRPPEAVKPILDGLRARAVNRNRLVVERVNAYLSPVGIDYEKDVLPLTPAGTATERHIVIAYLRAVERQAGDPAAFWAAKLDLSQDQVQALLQDSPKLQNQIRGRLMKRGGVGYIEPAPATFPTVDEFHQLILACQALPCAAWLDGTSPGEQAMPELLELLVRKGVVALNIIPDRNWNIPDAQARAEKIRNFYAVVELAREMELPIHVGTEMNSFGQKLVDDFDAPELQPLRPDFLAGAWLVYGHTALQRALSRGYQSDWAVAYFPARKERNAFYSQVGRRIPPGEVGLKALEALEPAMSPQEMLKRLNESEGVYA